MEVLKGVGILLIVLHNFFHSLTPPIGENEFTFQHRIVSNFYQTIIENPAEILRAIFTYFGHYGVQIFVFFSAYGLTKKYQHKVPKTGDFYKDRFDKIYISFLLCMAIYIIFVFGSVIFLNAKRVIHWDDMLWKVLLVSNFVPYQALQPVGPWWFIPFILQFYLLYPILLYLFKNYGNKFLLVTSLCAVALEVGLNSYLTKNGLNLNFMVFGHLSVLCLGMYFAAQKEIRIRSDIAVCCLFLFVIGNVNEYAWTTTDLTFTVIVLVISIMVFDRVVNLSPLTVSLAFFGSISFHLFMVNGFFWRSPFRYFAEMHNIWWIDNLAAIASLVCSTLFALFLRRLDVELRQYLRRARVGQRLILLYHKLL